MVAFVFAQISSLPQAIYKTKHLRTDRNTTVQKWKRVIRFSLGIVIISAIAACATRYVADQTAGLIYKNVESIKDREYPPTAQPIPYTSAELLQFGGRGMGINCSLPDIIAPLFFERNAREAPVSLQFRQACAYHDYCYRHGAATYGFSQAQCDHLLQEHAFRLCKQIYTSERDCEVDAKKVLLGVRMFGAGAFRPRPSIDIDQETQDNLLNQWSSYFEFDHQPQWVEKYSVVRVADAPASQGLAKAAYLFDVKPSGIRVQALTMAPNGGFVPVAPLDAPVDAPFTIPASYAFLTSAPLFVKSDSEDWFVWWQRRSRTGTGGRFVFLRPRTATHSDWISVFTAKSTDCSMGAPPNTAVFHCEPKRDLEFLQLRPRISHDNALRLTATAAHSCGSGTNQSPCFVEIEFNPETGNVAYTRHRMHIPGCADKMNSANGIPISAHCDRYRHFVSAPIQNWGETQLAEVVALRRGQDESGAKYKNTISPSRSNSGCSLTEDSARCTSNLNTIRISEADEPIHGLYPEKPLRHMLSFRLKDPEKPDERFDLVRIDLDNDEDPSSVEVDPLVCEMPAEINGEWLAVPASVLRRSRQGDYLIVLLRRSLINAPGDLRAHSEAIQLSVAFNTLPERGCPRESWTTTMLPPLLFKDIAVKPKTGDHSRLLEELAIAAQQPIIVVRGLDPKQREDWHIVWVAFDAPTLTRWWTMPATDVKAAETTIRTGSATRLANVNSEE